MATPAEVGTSPKVKIVWARDLKGRRPARDFYDTCTELERRQIARTLGRIESGEMLPRTHFKALRADLFEVKQFQIRILGAFQSGALVLAHGLRKKQNELPPESIETAQRILREHGALAQTRAHVLASVPTPKPDFRPSVLAPPTARPEPAVTMAPDLRAAAFRKVESEYVWSYVKASDLLAPDAPLMKSLVRLPRLHNLLMHEELAPYVAERLKALPIDARLALGLLDDNTTVLMLGAVWAVELMTARAVIEEQKAEDAAAPPPPPDPEPVPASDRKLYWIMGRKRNKWGPCVTRLLWEVLRPGRTCGRGPVVHARRWIRHTQRWSNVVTCPAALFRDKASLRDPIVIEALQA